MPVINSFYLRNQVRSFPDLGNNSNGDVVESHTKINLAIRIAMILPG